MQESKSSKVSRRSGEHQSMSVGDDGNEYHVIDGLRYPRQERQIDQLGYETTKHCLHFHGADWDIPLTQQRDELTANFIAEAAANTDEPESNISDLRFIVNDHWLSVTFTVRHKPNISSERVQEQLAHAPWSKVKSMYKPRTRAPRPQRKNRAEEVPPPLRERNDLSLYGRVNVGPDGPQFVDAADPDEEPYPLEMQHAAEVRRVQGGLMQTIGIPGGRPS